MALTRPGGPYPGGATPPPGASPAPPGPYGGPAWRPPGNITPPNIGNLAAGVGHPSSFYTNGGVAAGTGYHIQGMGTHPALQHILGTGTTALGTPPGSSPPAWWPQGAPWPPARNWFGPPPGGGGDPYGPPVAPPPNPHWVGPPVQPPGYLGPPVAANPILNYLTGYYSVANGG